MLGNNVFSGPEHRAQGQGVTQRRLSVPRPHRSQRTVIDRTDRTVICPVGQGWHIHLSLGWQFSTRGAASPRGDGASLASVSPPGHRFHSTALPWSFPPAVHPRFSFWRLSTACSPALQARVLRPSHSASCLAICSPTSDLPAPRSMQS